MKHEITTAPPSAEVESLQRALVERDLDCARLSAGLAAAKAERDEARRLAHAACDIAHERTTTVGNGEYMAIVRIREALGAPIEDPYVRGYADGKRTAQWSDAEVEKLRASEAANLEKWREAHAQAAELAHLRIENAELSASIEFDHRGVLVEKLTEENKRLRASEESWNKEAERHERDHRAADAERTRMQPVFYAALEWSRAYEETMRVNGAAVAHPMHAALLRAIDAALATEDPTP